MESCPQYFELFEGEVLEHGPFRKFTPPARARSRRELDAMWESLALGRIDYVSTDHAPSTQEQKNAGSIWDVHFGLPGIDTTPPVLLDACAAGRWTVRDEEIHSRAGWSPFAGRELVGGAVRTYVRGRLAAAGREVVAEAGLGRFVPGAGA